MFGKKINDEVVEETVESVSRSGRIIKELVEWVLVIVIAVVVAFLIKQYLFAMVVVDGQSMDYTLEHGDKLCVVRFNYTPENGDVIVFNPYGNKEKPYIKRIIATEGQSIYVNPDTREVYVDGKLLKEDYIGSETVAGISFPADKNGIPTDNPNEISMFVNASMDEPYVVPDGYVFAMGDNRSHSHDCRAIGPVNEKDIIGKAVFRWYPFDKFGTIK